MKKHLLFFLLLSVILVPQLVLAANPFVSCGNEGADPCTLTDLFQLIVKVYNFIVWDIATPLATLVILIGGILMLLSGMNAKWYDTGKNMVKWAIISILLIWGAFLIIDTIFLAIGYKPITPWSNPF